MISLHPSIANDNRYLTQMIKLLFMAIQRLLRLPCWGLITYNWPNCEVLHMSWVMSANFTPVSAQYYQLLIMLLWSVNAMLWLVLC